MVDVGIGGRITKLILKKYGVRKLIGFIWLRIMQAFVNTAMNHRGP